MCVTVCVRADVYDERRAANENLFDLRNICSFIATMPTAAVAVVASNDCRSSIFGEREREFGTRY